jgi:hypothetical protein
MKLQGLSLENVEESQGNPPERHLVTLLKQAYFQAIPREPSERPKKIKKDSS